MAIYIFYGDAVVVVPFVDLPDGPTADSWTFSKEFSESRLTYKAQGASETWTEYSGSFQQDEAGTISGTINGITTFYKQDNPLIYEGEEFYDVTLYVLEHELDFADVARWLDETAHFDQPWLSALPEDVFLGDDLIDLNNFSKVGSTIVVQGGAGDDEIAQDLDPINYQLEIAGHGEDISDIHDRRLDFSVEEYLDIAAKLTANIDGGIGNDTITGAFGDNTLIGNGGDDRLIGFGGDDRYIGGAGNDKIEGVISEFREGLHTQVDTAVYAGESSQYSLIVEPFAEGIIASNLQRVIDNSTSVESYLRAFSEANPEFSAPHGYRYSVDSLQVIDREADRDGIDELRLVDRLEFADQTIDLATIFSANRLQEDQIHDLIEIYIAFFDRAPDALGLYFWGHYLAEGMSLETITSHFASSAEAQALYPFTSPSETFITAVYQNVLNRSPEPEGLAFWSTHLDSGIFTRDVLVLEIIRGAQAGDQPSDTDEISSQRAADLLYLEAKSDLGAYFSVVKGMSNVENARSAMDLFDGSSESIAAAKSSIDGFYADALGPDDGEFLVSLVGVIDDPFMV
jgi:uncharacterized protein DUF4214/hemolysin type calcium-binding protein